MGKNMMHCLVMEASSSSSLKAKLANNVIVSCVGVIHNVKVEVCGVEVVVDMHVMPSKGEGYSIILGSPWLIVVNAKLD